MDRPLAIVPILWNNDDVPELTRPETPYEQVLSQAAEIGYRGIELGSNFPRDAAVLSGALKDRGLALSAAYYARDFTRTESRRQDIEEAARLARFLAEVGARVLVVADVIRPQREPHAGSARAEHEASSGDFARMAEAFQEIASRVKALGITCAFHNHAGTYVETEAEIERFLSSTDPSLVKFCLDTGHAVVGGADPVALATRHGERIAHIHLKDVDPLVLGDLRSQRQGFYAALRSYVFCELGTGCVPVSGVLDALRGAGYSGWLTVEQDTTRRGAVGSAETSFRYLAPLLAPKHLAAQSPGFLKVGASSRKGSGRRPLAAGQDVGQVARARKLARSKRAAKKPVQRGRSKKKSRV